MFSLDPKSSLCCSQKAPLHVTISDGMSRRDIRARRRKVRAGAWILLMAADPINRGILRSVLERPLELEPGRFYQVSAGGQEALYAGFVVERWLQSAPHGPLDFDGKEADDAVAALAEAWS